MFKHFFGELIAFISSIFLSLSNSYIHLHSGRTGDFDAIFSFIFVLTMYILVFKKDDFLKIVFLGFMVSSAFLVKSFAFLQIFLVIFLYYLFNKELKLKNLFFIFLIALIPILIWVYFRYKYDGFVFFKKMIDYDLLNRSKVAIEGHPATNFHYLEPILLNNLFWSLFLIPAFLYKNRINFNYEKGLSFDLMINEFLAHPFVLSWLLGTLVLPFIVKTKCAWYVNSIHPVMALIAGWYVVNEERLKFKKWLFYFVVFNFLALWIRTFFLNEQSVYKEINEQKPLVEVVKNLKEPFYFDPDNALQADIFILEVMGGGLPHKMGNGLIFTRNLSKFNKDKFELVTNLNNGWYLIKMSSN